MIALAIRSDPPHYPDGRGLRIAVGFLGLLLVAVLLSGCTVNLILPATTKAASAAPAPAKPGPNPCALAVCRVLPRIA